jgi:hypothetical protein
VKITLISSPTKNKTKIQKNKNKNKNKPHTVPKQGISVNFKVVEEI